MPMKKCSRCNTEKELTEFYKSIIGKKGEQLYKSGCIQCRRRPEKVWEPKPPKEKKIYKDKRVNRVRKPEETRCNNKRYYDKNREKICEKQREYTRLKNLNKIQTKNVEVLEEVGVL